MSKRMGSVLNVFLTTPIVLLTFWTIVDPTRAQQSTDAPDGIPQGIHVMMIGPVPGLTSDWHVAPSATAIPLGDSVQFRQPAPPEAQITWIGAYEVLRNESGSVAECPLREVGSHSVRVQVLMPDGGQGQDSIELDIVDIAPESIELRLSVWVDPVELDQNSTNPETMFYFRFPSVADLKDLGDGRYRTSVQRRLNFDATVDPPEFKPLIEWRIDNTTRLSGPVMQSFADVGWHDISAGPLNNPAKVQIETYRVRITSHTSWRDIVPEGEPITFEAVTEPNGYENEITWISSTKYGTAAPVISRGPTFTAQFDDTWGRHGSGIGFQWLGVRADDAVFNQDQKNKNANRCCCCWKTWTAPGEWIICKTTSSKDTGDSKSVFFFSGELFETPVDLRIRGRGLDFIWARTYRSRFGLDTVQGNGWDFSYNVSLRQSGPNITVLEGNARTDLYLLQPNGTWTIKEAFRTLSQNMNGSYTMTFADTGRWDFHPFDGSPWEGRLSAIVDRNGNTLSFDYDGLGRLITIHDTLDNPPGNPREITIAYNDDGFIESVTDFIGRQVRYEYYQDGNAGGSFGDLKSATTPAVLGTPTGNDFPDGKTTIYTYSKGFAEEALNHNLLTITDPKGQTFATNTYGDSGFSFDRVTREVFGEPGDIVDFVYGPVEPSAENNFAISQVIMNDRVGNVTEILVDANNSTVIQREYTGRWDPDEPTTPAELPTPDLPKLRNEDPDFFETRWIRNADALPLEITHPNGNVETFVYDEDNPDRRSRGNTLRHCREPGTHTPPGDQAQICEEFEYETGFGGCCGTNFVTRHVDGRGHETLHTYDESGNREHTQHRIPSIVEDFTYNEFGQTTSHTLPDNGSGSRREDVFTYYDESEGHQFGYRKEQIIDAPGFALTTMFEYDFVGNTTLTIDPEGHDMQYVFNQLDQVVRSTSAEVEPGGVRYERDTYYDANDNVVRVDIQNKDDAGVLQANTHFTTIHEYEILNYRIRTCEEVGDFTGTIPGTINLPECAGLPAADFITTEYEYDENRNRTLVRYGEATENRQPTNVVRTRYDERDLVFRETRAPGDADRSTSQYDYDPNENVVRTSQGIEDAPRVSTNTYDGYDRRVASLDPMGNASEVHYDANSNVGGDQSPGMPNPFGTRVFGELFDIKGQAANVRLSEMSYEYDAMDRLIRQAVEFFDTDTQAPIVAGMPPDDKVTTVTEWSDNSQVRRVIDDNAHVTRTVYDTANRVDIVTDAKDNIVKYVYDRDSLVVRVEETELSDLGGDPEIFNTYNAYDGIHRLTSTQDNVRNTHHFAYDSRDNQTFMDDALEHETRYVYDGINRLIRSVRDLDGDGADPTELPGNTSSPDIVTAQIWDDTSRLVGQTDDSNNTTVSVYDALNRLTEEVMADCTQHAYTYDVHDNRLSMTDANGSFAACGYDLLNRLTVKLIDRAPGVLGTTFEFFGYDGLSRLVIAVDNDSIVTRSHDSLSRVTRETLNTQTTVCLYDGVGNQLACTYPGGRFITCTYDKLDRKAVITDATGPPATIATYAYVGPGRVARREYGNGTRTDYKYDGITGIPNDPEDFGVKRIVRTRHVFDPGGPNEMIIDDRTYTWDKMYNKTQRKDIRAGAGAPGLTHDYAYDDIYRLTRTIVTDPAMTVVRDTTYNLDGVGNRDEVIGAPDPGSYVGPYTLIGDLCVAPADQDMNQYTTTPFDAREYDENGNLILRNQPGGGPAIAEIHYDYRNQMVEYNDLDAGQRHTYAYDALGRRIARVVDADGAAGGPTETRYFYDGWQVVEERDAAGATQATYVYGRYIDEVLNMRRGTGVPPVEDFFFHADDLYHVMAVTNATGEVVERYEYLDYGQPEFFDESGISIPQSAIANPYLFTGRRYDVEIAWYYYRTRYLDPITGRFTTRDTLGTWHDLPNLGNGYAYVWNSPVTGSDPFGLDGFRRHTGDDGESWTMCAYSYISYCEDMLEKCKKYAATQYKKDSNTLDSAQLACEDCLPQCKIDSEGLCNHCQFNCDFPRGPDSDDIVP